MRALLAVVAAAAAHHAGGGRRLLRGGVAGLVGEADEAPQVSRAAMSPCVRATPHARRRPQVTATAPAPTPIATTASR
ncbi:hypothetical protein ADL32_03770 [Streptomyces albidoflavus]|nr:hypothetical protein ADL32_03770 [Streptomyces albidoflavus]